MTRRAWTWVLAGYVAMAIGFTVFAFLLAHQVSQNRSIAKQNRATVQRLDTTQMQLRTLACQLDAHIMETERVSAPDHLCNP